MRRFPYIRLFLILLAAGAVLLAGCGKGAGDTSSKEEPPQFRPLTVLEPEAPGSQVIGNPPLLLDISNISQGYFTAQSEEGSSRLNLQLIGPDGITYSYFLDSGEEAAIPFTAGEGDYLINTYENINLAESKYAALYTQTLTVKLDNPFLPYLYANQYVHFTKDSKASQLALSMLPQDAGDLEALDAIYDYVITHVAYDYEKAETVENGYLPDVDETLETGMGICFDYAALMTAMLRSRDIPCKLQIGYSGQVKHAWIDVYIKEKGWIEKAIAFDGDTWTRMDPTFAASDQSGSILDYIGDGTNYTVQFTR